MHYGQMFQSHALHFFHLASPDLLFGFDAPVAKRNVIGVVAAHPDLAVQGVLMRKFGQEIIKATAGKKIHGTGAIPGGINKNLSIAERDALLADIDQMIEWAPRRWRSPRTTRSRTWSRWPDFGSFDSNHLSHRPRRRRDGPLRRQAARHRRRRRARSSTTSIRRTTSTRSPRRCGPGRT